MKKNVMIAIAIIVCFVIGSMLLFLNKKTPETKNIDNPNQLSAPIEKRIEHPKKDKSNTITEKKTPEEKEADVSAAADDKEKTIKAVNLTGALTELNIPLSAISVVSQLPQNIQQKVIELAHTNDIFMIQKTNNKLFIITNNPANLRHNIEFTEIRLDNGHQSKTTLGYNDKMKDSDNDSWEFSLNSNMPLKHVKYNTNGDLEFSEIWNYDQTNPIKYEMKDSEGHVISLRKESNSSDNDLRIEHIIYDKNGNTKMNISATYEGNDVTRFTYYNSDNIESSASIFGEYEDGIKTKETVYTSDYKVKNLYTPVLKDGEVDEITVWDNHNNEVLKLKTSEPETDSL